MTSVTQPQGAARTVRSTQAVTPAAAAITNALVAGPDIPDVKKILASSSEPIQRNEAFNAAYQAIAEGMQAVLEPGFVRGRVRSEVLPNWFAVGAHASPQAGHSMIAMDRGVRALELLKGSPNVHTRKDVFDAMGFAGGIRMFAETVAGVSDGLAGRQADATALGVAAALMLSVNRASNPSALLLDPRLGVAVATRLWSVVAPPQKGLLGTIWDGLKGLFGSNRDAQESEVIERVGTLLKTYKSLLGDGNRMIFADIGASAETFLRLRQKAGGSLTPDDVLKQLKLPQSDEGSARKLYQWAVANATSIRSPADVRSQVQTKSGNDAVRAGFAMYELAQRTADPRKKNALVSMANNLIAWREQAQSVQPAFVANKKGEMDRRSVLKAVTPLIQVVIGQQTWTFSDFALRRGDMDGNPLTSPASETNWSNFDERWPAILDSFQFSYAFPDDVWRFEDPKLRTAA